MNANDKVTESHNKGQADFQKDTEHSVLSPHHSPPHGSLDLLLCSTETEKQLEAENKAYEAGYENARNIALSK